MQLIVNLDHSATRRALSVAVERLKPSRDPVGRVLLALDWLHRLPVPLPAEGEVVAQRLEAAWLHAAYVGGGDSGGAILLSLRERREEALADAELELISAERSEEPEAHGPVDELDRLIDLARVAGITATHRLYHLAVEPNWRPEIWRGVTLDEFLLARLGDPAGLALAISERCGEDAVRVAFDLAESTLPRLQVARRQHPDLNGRVVALTRELYPPMRSGDEGNDR